MQTIRLRIILNLIGLVLFFEGLFMSSSIIVAIIYNGTDIYAHIYSSIITILSGTILYVSTIRRNLPEASLRDSLIAVSLSWIVMSIFGAFPYLISGAIPRFVDALFESVSGFTTTGASILTDIESLPKGILFWRSLTHWIGGMGIIVLVVAVFPYFGVSANNLSMAEGSLFSVSKLKPRVIEVARRLWAIYVLLTVLEIIFLRAFGMNLYESVCHSFGTVATGGFSPKNTSIMNYPTPIHIIITVFMFLSGVNFGLHFLLLTGRAKSALRDQELHLYTFITVVASLGVTLILYKNGMNFGLALRDATFQTVSLMTCTGFMSADYMLWPSFAWHIMFLLLFASGCTGSTAGGIKMVRHLIAIKSIRVLIQRMIYPNSVVTVRYNNKSIDRPMVVSVFGFIFMYIGVFILGSVILTGTGIDIQTSMGSVATTLGGIGPGIGTVGPASNFFAINDFSKFYLSFNMILGRLEIIPLLVIFTRAFWKA